MTPFDKEIPDEVPSRYTGLVDAVKSGWLNQDTNEIYRNFAVTVVDTV